MASRDIARRRVTNCKGDEGVDVRVYRVAGGQPEAMAAARLVAASVGVLPGVLKWDGHQRRGAAKPHLRTESMGAALVPFDGTPLAEGIIGLSFEGGESAVASRLQKR
eukprot:6203156-Pleurochrysis_carterae.AAC.3